MHVGKIVIGKRLISYFFAFACKAQRFPIALLFPFFPRRNFSGISGNSERKNILQTIKQLIQFSCCHTRTFFWFILFLNKPQQGGTPQRLVDKYSPTVYLYVIKIGIK